MQSRAYPRHHEELKMKKEQINDQTTPSRRGFFMGAAAVGAATAAVTAMPGLSTPSAELNKLPPAPENGGGYSLSEHVKRYYQTTRV
jgi:hypothetical protein